MTRTLPHNLEAERSVLSACMIDATALAVVMDTLSPEDFYEPAHRAIMDAIFGIERTGKAVDLVTVIDHLAATGKLDSAGGPDGISDISGKVSTTANVGYWAGIVKDKATVRKMATEATAIVRDAYNDPEDVAAFIDSAGASILDVTLSRSRAAFRPVNSIAKDSLKIIEGLDKRKGALTGVPSGFPDLDTMTSGFQGSDLVILAGRPSMGKTALALNIARNAAIDHGKRVAFFSLEMADTQLVNRLISSEAGISMNRLKLGNYGKNEWGKISDAFARISKAPIIIDDSANLSIIELKSRARRAKSEHRLDMVVVDYLQLLSGASKKHDSREQEIAEISRGLKALAKELEAPVLALSQLNRSAEKREDKTPILSDLRESGSLEQDADVIMFVHRPGVFDKGATDKAITKLIVGKQRNGPTGDVTLTFLEELTQFKPHEGRYDDGLMPE